MPNNVSALNFVRKPALKLHFPNQLISFLDYLINPDTKKISNSSLFKISFTVSSIDI